MANAYNNGHDPTRLDRLEGLVEVIMNQHIEFEAEHKRLLIAQVVLNDELTQLSREVRELRANAKDSDARMDALIAVVDDLVRRTPPHE